MTLVGYWPLDENSGDALDYSGNENHGTVNGAIQGVGGILGKTAYENDGTDYSNGPVGLGNAFPSPSAFSMSAWVNHQSTKQWYVFYAVEDGTGSAIRFGSGDSGNDNLKIFIRQDNNTEIQLNGDNIPQNEWSHIAISWDGSLVKLFLNGIEVASGSYSSNVRPTTKWSIGGGTNFGGMDGNFCEVRYYNRALTPHEIQYLYQVSQQGYALTEEL